ncbi:MAG: nuclear transport factor 2 family protein [Bacteroidetes bacterium]|nr:nuclear transport factor 2 family protein [Bacteroidota bacterium]
MPDIRQIADRLVALCREQKFVEAYKELYSEDAESIDPLYAYHPPSKGLINLIEREKQFLAKTQINSITISDPLVTGNHFAIKLSMDYTHEVRGRVYLEELCVYHVKDGKIVSQQFFIG